MADLSRLSPSFCNNWANNDDHTQLHFLPEKFVGKLNNFTISDSP
jgi:hypothetical protein